MVDEASVAKQIVSYFLRNPKAADTLEGIARWRLLEEQIHQSVRVTERAVWSLVAAGLLVAEQTAGAETIYHLNEARRTEAEDFIGAPFGRHLTRRRKSLKRR
jgi:hypothetical protein